MARFQARLRGLRLGRPVTVLQCPILSDFASSPFGSLRQDECNFFSRFLGLVSMLKRQAQARSFPENHGFPEWGDFSVKLLLRFSARRAQGSCHTMLLLSVLCEKLHVAR